MTYKGKRLIKQQQQYDNMWSQVAVVSVGVFACVRMV